VELLMKKKIIGCTSFLNVKPLLIPLQEKVNGNGYAVVLKTPELLSRMLRRGETDISLIPSIDLFTHPMFHLLPGIAISSVGKVASVMLFSKVPLPEIQTVLLDSRSRTSVALLKILFEKYYGLHPRYIAHGPGHCTSEKDVDARLVIGDEALKESLSSGGNGAKDSFYSLDLGEAWTNVTGLPFVYAVFVTCRKQLVSTFSHLLLQSRATGFSRIKEIARSEAIRLGLHEEQCMRYLMHHIHYDLGSKERQALSTFQSLALEVGLIEEARPLFSNHSMQN
jgi:chorismate dehydratase